VSFYTKKGDDGTTGLLYGGRVPKTHAMVRAGGDVDEAQSFIGLARAETGEGSELDRLLIEAERGLWVLMAELATAAENRPKLKPGKSLVTAEMVHRIGELTDDISGRFTLPDEFVVPGQNRLSASLDVARTVVRRAERSCVEAAAEGSRIVPYLNRLSSLLWALARWQEGESLPARSKEIRL
jgi:cob(I)alamin adenosyltransferase